MKIVILQGGLAGEAGATQDDAGRGITALGTGDGHWVLINVSAAVARQLARGGAAPAHPELFNAGVRAQGDYLRALRQAAHDALARGQQELDAPPLVGHEATTGHARHALNWQRAWRQAEEDWLRGVR